MAWSVTSGVLFKPRRNVGIGAAYIGGATFSLETRLFGRFLWTQFDPEGDVVLTGTKRRIDYVIPARLAVGASWRVANAMTVLFDVTRIRYSSRITENFLVVDFIDPGAGLSPANFYVNDVYESHAGLEYRLYRNRATFAFRGGLFTDPGHPLRFRSGGNNLDHPADKLLDFRFNTLPQKTEIGGTAGAGFALANRIQVDAAASISPSVTQFVMSIVMRVYVVRPSWTLRRRCVETHPSEWPRDAARVSSRVSVAAASAV